MRRRLFILVSVLVSVLFLWLALRNVPVSDIVARIQTANLWWILAAFGLHALSQWTRAVRWSGLLDFNMPTMQAFHVLNIGFLLNQLPLRAGEFARMLLATRSKVPLFTAATSVVVERMLDTLLVVIMLVVTISRLTTVPDEIIAAIKLFGVAAVAAFAVLLVFARFPAVGHRTLAVVERTLPFLKRFNLSRLLDHVLDGLKPLIHWRSGLHAIIWTLISWAVSIATVYALVQSLNISGVDILSLTVLALSLAALSIAIPVSVASIGIFESAVQVAGRAVGLAGTPLMDATALSLGFLFHGINIFGYAFWGFIGLLRTGISLSDVMTAQKTEPEVAEMT